MWRLKCDALGTGPAVPAGATQREVLAALCKALDQACVVAPCAQCDMAWKNEPAHWMPLQWHLESYSTTSTQVPDEVAAALASALCSSTQVMALQWVCWFDVSTPVTLSPGVWQLRFRVMMLPWAADQASSLSIKLENLDEAAGNSGVRLAVEDHWPRSPYDVAHDVADVVATMQAGGFTDPARERVCPVRRMVPARGSAHLTARGAGPVLRFNDNPLATWLYVSAGVVYVPPRCTGRVRVRLYDHSGTTHYRGWLVDAVQAVPLHDPARWPLPGKVVRALGCHM